MTAKTENNLELHDDRFGLCPQCLRQGVCVSGPDHWFICKRHKTRWYVGFNLLSGWSGQTAEERASNARLLAKYRVVEPAYHPQSEAPEASEEPGAHEPKS